MSVTPDQTTQKAGRGASAWRDALAGATAVLLFITAISNMFFVVPKYRRLLEGLNAVVSLPARLAIGISHFGLALIVLGAAAVSIGYWKDRQAKTGLFHTVLAACALLAGLYLALVTWVYLDVAKVMDFVQ